MTTIHQINEKLKAFAAERGLDFNEAKIVLALERVTNKNIVAALFYNLDNTLSGIERLVSRAHV